MAYGSDAAQKLLRGIGGGILTVDDEVRLLNGLLALGFDPAQVRSFSDRDPSRRYIGDAVTRALRAGISEENIRRAIAFDEVARTEHDPVRRVQRLAEVLGVDMGRVTQIANSRGGSVDAWIGAVEEVGRAGQAGGRSSVVGTDAAVQTFGAYARSQQGTYIGKGDTRQGGAAPAQPGTTRPPGGRAIQETDIVPGVPGRLPAPTAAGPAGPAGQRAPGTATQAPGAGAVTDTTPALGAGASQDAVNAYVRRHYSQYAWMLDVPDIAAVMRQAAEKGWAADEVWGAFIASPWYKTTEPKARLWAELRSVDPAAAKDQVKDQATVLKNQGLSLGINIPAAELNQLAEDSLKFGWTDNEVRAALGKYYAYDPKNLLGAAQATAAHLKQQAKDWLVPISEATIGQWTEQVIRGEMTTDYFDTYLAQQAQSLYPQLEEPISRGVAPGRWMASYKEIAADTLGIDPETIDLRDEKWMRSINQVDEKGGRSAMTLYDWKNLLKTDESYGYDKTQAGRDHGATLARNIAAQFGFATGRGF